jgi:hypothetical protein
LRYTGANAGGFLRVFGFKDIKAFAEACGVFVGDGEDTDAALKAAWVADEVRAAAAVGIGDCGVYDLDEGLPHCVRWKVRALRECPHLRIEIWGTQRFEDADSREDSGAAAMLD